MSLNAAILTRINDHENGKRTGFPLFAIAFAKHYQRPLTFEHRRTIEINRETKIVLRENPAQVIPLALTSPRLLELLEGEFETSLEPLPDSDEFALIVAFEIESDAMVFTIFDSNI